MNILEKLQAQKIQVAIQVYKEASIKESKVLDTFPVRVPKDVTKPTKLFTNVSNYLYDFLRNDYSNYTLKKSLKDVKLEEVVDAIAQFSKVAKCYIAFDDFFYHHLYSTSQLLTTIGAMRLQNASNFNLSMLSDKSTQLLNKLCLKLSIEPNKYIVKLYEWYIGNKDRIRRGNRGTFEISIVNNVNTFIESILEFSIEHGIIYAGNMQWIAYLEYIKEVYKVDINCMDDLMIPNKIEYKQEIRPLWYWCLDVNERREIDG